MTPYFVHSPLLWGLLIVGVPVLIHLINMLRHRRVEWAAMEFLLFSQKKHRTWIILKQLLLLLLRMAAIAAVVFMLAQPKLPSEFGWLPGSAPIHHIVLVDDSYSMSDRWSDTSAFAEAKAVVRQIGKQAAVANGKQELSLLRFSRVARGVQPDLSAETVNRDEFVKELDGMVRGFEVSQSSIGPGEALKAIGQLMGNAKNERRIVYLISDFRSREWDDSTELQKQLVELNDAKAELHLINCVDRQRPNLAITSLVTGPEIRAARVPWKMKVSVKNFGTETVKRVPVLLEEDGRERPGVTIAEIPPGEVVSEWFEVRFGTAGPHQIQARLEADAVEADNSRFMAVDLAFDVPVLLIDNSDARGARYLDTVSLPGGSVLTGISPQIETAAYLNHQPLDRFAAIVLINFDRLDASAVEALEAYVRSGGGVAFFVGERTRAQFINDELYRDGQGLFPMPLVGPATLTVDRLQRAPDLNVGDHPIFRFLAGERNSFAGAVVVSRYFAVPEGFKPAADSTVRVICRLRNGAPLAVERRFGEGRVVAMLTTAAPVWNNWAKYPAYAVMLELQAYLAAAAVGDVSQQVGTKLEVPVDPQHYEKRVGLITPDETVPAVTVDAVTTASKDAVESVAFTETDVAGIYRALLTRKPDGTPETRRFAVNVDPEEGNLKALSGEQLAEGLKGVDYRYQQAAGFGYEVGESKGENIWLWILALLILLLIAEQILAWSISYHPKTQRAATLAAGGVR